MDQLFKNQNLDANDSTDCDQLVDRLYNAIIME